MSYTVGMSLEEIEAYARQILPQDIDVQVTQDTNPAHLTMFLRCRNEIILQTAIMATMALTDPPSSEA